MRLPKAFGKYVLTEKIASGGMAEVFRAKTYGVGGFEKILAIKRIHPQFAANQQFISMLIDEAKINVVLSHANIVQVFDLGKIGDDYFIAMELINGKDLHRILRKLKYKNQQMPVDIAVYMISEACKGLDYAHKKKDPQGKPLGLVHRDVSPQNILTSFEGEVKVVDFGIAKAGVKNRDTTGGVLKGKISYMSPEQASGDFIDHRSDVFAIGAVLHEALTGAQLFQGENDYYTLEAVRAAHVKPPSVFRPEVPIELSKIVLRALAQEPDDRYQEAGQLHLDLTRFLYSRAPGFSSTRLAEFMKDLFSRELEKTGVTGTAQKTGNMTRVDYVVARDQSLVAGELEEEGQILQTRPVIPADIADSTRRVKTPLPVEETFNGRLSHTTPTRQLQSPGPAERAVTQAGGVVHRFTNLLSRNIWRDTGRLFVGRIEEFLTDLTPSGARVVIFSLLMIVGFFGAIFYLLVRDTDLAGPYVPEPTAAVEQPRAYADIPRPAHLPFFDNAAQLETDLRDAEERARHSALSGILEGKQKELDDAVKGLAKGKKVKKADAAGPPAAGEEAIVSVNAFPWAHVFFDDAPRPLQTPLQNHRATAGKHEIKACFSTTNRCTIRKVILKPGRNDTVIFRED